MKKLNNKKGFTLAELLIVVAIIGVLTAVAIPVFSAQLDKSKEASNIANARSLYAALSSDYIDNSKIDGTVGGFTPGTAVDGPFKDNLTYAESASATAQKFAFDLKEGASITITYADGTEPGVKLVQAVNGASCWGNATCD